MWSESYKVFTSLSVLVTLMQANFTLSNGKISCRFQCTMAILTFIRHNYITCFINMHLSMHPESL